jgi:hypothetical protein
MTNVRATGTDPGPELGDDVRRGLVEDGVHAREAGAVDVVVRPASAF